MKNNINKFFQYDSNISKNKSKNEEESSGNVLVKIKYLLRK